MISIDGTISPYFNNIVGDNIQTVEMSDEQTGVISEVTVLKKANKQMKNDMEKDAITITSTKDNQFCLSSSSLSPQKLLKRFYEQKCIVLAKALLGQVLVRVVDGKRVSGKIVETESYLGGIDVASHSYNGKRTPRNEPMYMEPGTVYVYKIYGMYHCLNISSKEEGSCVLIRSLAPIDGVDYMMDARQERRKSLKSLKPQELCSGPSKLCQALNITKELCNKEDASASELIWLEKGLSVPENQIVTTKRVGIDSVGPEWANKPLRFYVFNDKNVSVRDKKAESKMLDT